MTYSVFGGTLKLAQPSNLLADMMSVNGDADAAVEVIVQKGWVPLLSSIEVTFLMRGKLYVIWQ